MMRCATAACLFLVLLPSGAAGQTGGQQLEKPQYVQKLRLPTEADQLGFPESVVVDLHTSEVFVADMRMRRIAIFDHRGMALFQIRGGRRFHSPKDLAVDPEGYILLAASHSEAGDLAWLDFDGASIRTIELHGPEVEGASEPDIWSVALSPDGGTMYVLDQANLALWIADRDGLVSRVVYLLEGRSELERRDATLGHVDVYGRTVVVAVPTDGQILLYEPDGTFRKAVGLKGSASCRTGYPVAGALDRDGRLIIIDKQRAIGMIWDPPTNKCLLEFSGIGRSPGALYQPTDIALDSRGRVYISQGLEGRIQLFKGFQPAAGAP